MTQNDVVLALLKAYGVISAHDLTYKHGITRCAARIFELRQSGYVIETLPGRTIDHGIREMAKYRLISSPEGHTGFETIPMFE